MSFVRDLGVPVPRVLDWCGDASQTPVEAEYIIMEEEAGTPLEKVWNDEPRLKTQHHEGGGFYRDKDAVDLIFTVWTS